jgi:hypothetical protein
LYAERVRSSASSAKESGSVDGSLTVVKARGKSLEVAGGRRYACGSIDAGILPSGGKAPPRGYVLRKAWPDGPTAGEEFVKGAHLADSAAFVEADLRDGPGVVAVLAVLAFSIFL